MAEAAATKRRARLERATGVSGNFRAPARRSNRVSNQSGYPANQSQYRSQYTRQSRPNRNFGFVDYSPTRLGDKAGGSIGGLEAEFIGGLLLIFLTVFTDTQSSYQDKLLAVMKRGTMLALLFFILALIANSGANAARASKAFGALVIVSLFLMDYKDGFVSEFDSFFHSTWTSSGESGGSSDNAAAGQQSPGILGQVGNDIKTGIGDLIHPPARDENGDTAAGRSPTGTVTGSRL